MKLITIVHCHALRNPRSFCRYINSAVLSQSQQLMSQSLRWLHAMFYTRRCPWLHTSFIFFIFFGYQTTQSRHAHVFQNFFAVAGRKRWTDHVLRALISRARQRTRRAVISTQHAATIRHILDGSSLHLRRQVYKLISEWTRNGTGLLSKQYATFRSLAEDSVDCSWKSLTFHSKTVSHFATETLTFWRPLLPYGYSYKASCTKPG